MGGSTDDVEIYNRIEPLAPEWEHLARQIKASPFLWPGWISAWWSAFGAGQLQILAVRKNERLAGVLPLRSFRGALSSTSNDHTPLFGLLTVDEVAAKQLSHALFSQNPRHIILSFLSPSDDVIPLARSAAEVARYQVLTESIQAAPYVTIDRTWAEYESQLRRKFRSELRRRRRRLEEEGRLTLEIYDGTERLDELLEEGIRAEGSGWKDASGTSIRRDPAARRFYTEVARWATEHGWLRLAFLRLDGRTIAFDYGLEYNDTHYLLKTGYDPDYRKFGPGMIIRYLMIARAFSEGLATYDFLGVGADYAWKQEWAKAQEERLFLRMFAPTVRGSIDRAVYVTSRTGFEVAKRFARSSVVGEGGRRKLKRAYSAVYNRLKR